MNNNKLIKS